MTDTIYAIETAEETARQYLAGSPFYAGRLWAAGETQQRFELTRNSKAEGAAKAATMRFTDLGQQVYKVTFSTHRVYPSVREALLAAFRQGTAHRWGGTAVMLVRVHGETNEWKVYRAPKSVLSGNWYVQGSTVFLNYTLRVPAWTVEGSTETISSTAIVDEGGYPILDEAGFPVLTEG